MPLKPVALLFSLFLVYRNDLTVCDDSADYYTAGVVEFRPNVLPMTSAEQLADNLQGYLDILHSKEAVDTDIIVFPESTLNTRLQVTYVPAPEEVVIPCAQTNDKYQYFLMQLSCAARDLRKYVVINLTEKEDCPAAGTTDTRPCANNGLNIYNTNVVFDRDGRVVSRYRKVHLYLEPKNSTLEPEFAIFDTDFGVRFGHLICFDINFYTPTEELVVRHGVTDFLFPNFWSSELPFLTSVQLQQSWAWGNNVNLLAAGGSYPQSGASGSGIYAGSEGALKSLIVTGNGVRQLLVARVPKIVGGKRSVSASLKQTPLDTSRQDTFTGISLLQDPAMHLFTSELIDFTQQDDVSRRLCSGKHCCQFEVHTLTVDSQPSHGSSVSYQYRLGAFAGDRTYLEAEWSTLKICSIYACTNESIASCGMAFAGDVPIRANIIFKSIKIEGAFVDSERLLLMPNSLTQDLYPLPASAVEWQVSGNGDHHDVLYRLDTEVDNLLTFAIYANYYQEDTTSSENSAHALTALPLAILLCSIVLMLLLQH